MHPSFPPSLPSLNLDRKASIGKKRHHRDQRQSQLLLKPPSILKGCEYPNCTKIGNQLHTNVTYIPFGSRRYCRDCTLRCDEHSFDFECVKCSERVLCLGDKQRFVVEFNNRSEARQPGGALPLCNKCIDLFLTRPLRDFCLIKKEDQNEQNEQDMEQDLQDLQNPKDVQEDLQDPQNPKNVQEAVQKDQKEPLDPQNHKHIKQEDSHRQHNVNTHNNNDTHHHNVNPKQSIKGLPTGAPFEELISFEQQSNIHPVNPHHPDSISSNSNTIYQPPKAIFYCGQK